MLLADAFTAYTRALHRRTLRPFLAYRVVTPANSNTRALPSLSLPRTEPWEVGASVLASHICLINPHTPAHKGICV